MSHPKLLAHEMKKGMRAVSRAAVFLDRDGVLVEEVFYPHTGEWEAPLVPEDVRLIPGAAMAARRLRQAAYALVLVSNQAAFAKGKTSLRALWLAHERFAALLAAESVTLDGVFYSYAHPEGVVPYFSGPSLDRKPGPYNLFIAAAQLDLDLSLSWFVGDRVSDLECARAGGVRAVLIDNPNAKRTDCQAPKAQDLGTAVGYIFNRSEQKARSAGYDG